MAKEIRQAAKDAALEPRYILEVHTRGEDFVEQYVLGGRYKSYDDVQATVQKLLTNDSRVRHIDVYTRIARCGGIPEGIAAGPHATAMAELPASEHIQRWKDEGCPDDDPNGYPSMSELYGGLYGGVI